MGNLMDELKLTSQALYCEKPEDLTTAQLHNALGKVVQTEIADNWAKSKKKHASGRRAYYCSAEFLMGRMMYNNLYCLGILDETKALLKKKGMARREPTSTSRLASRAAIPMTMPSMWARKASPSMVARFM